MSLRPYKFRVQPVCQQIDENGNVTGEVVIGGENGQPVELFGCEALKQWAADFPDHLQTLDAA